MSKRLPAAVKDKWPLHYCVLATAVCVSLALVRPAAVLRRHPDRQYSDFASFWPLYVNQHSLPATKLIHAVGTTVAMASVIAIHGGKKFGRLALGLTAGLSLALCAADMTASFATGLPEAVIMALLVVACARAFSGLRAGTILKTFGIGYLFAWVGHFFVEKNRPATFLHPTFSLLGDFQLLWQLVTNQLALDATTA